MKKPLMMSACNVVFWVLVAFASLASAQTVGQLIPHKVKLESVDYLGKRAVKIMEDGQVANGEAYAIVKGAVFHNGAIEVELAGRPADAASGSRNSSVKAQDTPSADALNGRWDLVFDLPDSQPYSQIKMPFELTFEADGKVAAIALGTPGLLLSDGHLERDQLVMRGKSVFGPVTLTATLTGNKLQGEWNAASFKGGVKGEKIQSRSSTESRLAVFDDVWTQVNQQFYDPRFNGVDWEAVRSRYRPRVASSVTDGQMLLIIREMLKELKSSHVGFYALSPDEVLIPRSAGVFASENKSASITWRKLTDDIGFLRVIRVR